MRSLTNRTFFIAAVFFLIFALSFHVVEGKGHVKKLAFDYYVKDSFLYMLRYVVAFNPIFSIPFNIIAIIEIFEKIKMFNRFLRKSNGDLSPKKVLGMRVMLLTTLFILTLLSTNIALIFELVGALFGPILGLILPVSLEN